MASHTRLWCIGAGACFLFSGCSSPPAEPDSAGGVQAEQRSEPARRAAPAELRDSLATRLSRSTQGLTPRRTQAGSTRLDLQGRFQHMSVATEGPDGQVAQRCISSPAELDAVLARQEKARQP